MPFSSWSLVGILHLSQISFDGRKHSKSRFRSDLLFVLRYVKYVRINLNIVSCKSPPLLSLIITKTAYQDTFHINNYETIKIQTKNRHNVNGFRKAISAVYFWTSRCRLR